MALFYGGSYAGWWKPTVIYDNFWPLFTVVNYFSFAQVFFLFIKGYYFPSEGEVRTIFSSSSKKGRWSWCGSMVRCA